MTAESARVRLAELVAALSLATDLGMGQLLEQALRTCLLAVSAGRELGLANHVRSDVFYLALLRFIGCTSDAHEQAALVGGDEIAFRAGVAPLLMGDTPEYMAYLARRFAADAPPLTRARIVGRVMASGSAGAKRSIAIHCEVARMLAPRIGLPGTVGAGFGHVFEMYYEEAGQGEPLVLLLGATGALDFHPAGWGALVPALSEHYRTFHIEHRGHGRTNNPAGRLSYTQMADDAAAFITRLGLAPAHVAGISDGASVGLVLGMTRSDLLRSLVCVGANYRQDEQLRQEMDEIWNPEAMERDAPAWVAAMVAAHDTYHHPGYWRELVRLIRANVDDLSYTEDDLRRITTPTLLIAGETDHYVSLAEMLEMRRSIPHSEMLILNHAGMDYSANHVVQHTRAEIVGPVMLEFLRRNGHADGAC